MRVTNSFSINLDLTNINFLIKQNKPNLIVFIKAVTDITLEIQLLGDILEIVTQEMELKLKIEER